jgi:hypothetical protein
MSDDTLARVRLHRLLDQTRARQIKADALMNKILAAAELRRQQIAWLEGTQPADPSRPNGALS